MEFDSDHRFRFPDRPEAFWAAIAETGNYRRWWPWLTDFDADGLAAGNVWRCAVRPPLRYTLRFAIHLDEVVQPALVKAHLTGDIAGTACLDIASHEDGADVRLTSCLEPGNRAFRTLATIARPVVRWGHDWVLATGASQFVERAAERAP